MRPAASTSVRRTVLTLVVGLAVVVAGTFAYVVPRLTGSDGTSATVGVPVTPSAAPLADPTPTPGPSPSATPSGGEDGPAPEDADPTPSSKKSSSAKSGSSKSGSTKSGSTVVTVPATGPGTYEVAGVRAASATTRGRLYRFDVRVEKGLDVDPDQAATAIAKTLNDERSWRGTGRWRFQLVKAGETADLHAYIVTPGTTNTLCAPLLTQGEVSCQAGNRVVLNAKRWLLGAPAYGTDVAGYRQYLVNHEFGHALGFGHLTCPKDGAPAPVMLQQTKGLQGCRKNPWPMTTGD